jgi:hypothetical protein
MTCTAEEKSQEATVEGQKILTCLPRVGLGLEIQIRSTMAGLQLSDNQIQVAHQIFKEMKVWLWNRTGLQVTYLEVVAKDLIPFTSFQLWVIKAVHKTDSKH